MELSLISKSSLRLHLVMKRGLRSFSANGQGAAEEGDPPGRGTGLVTGRDPKYELGTCLPGLSSFTPIFNFLSFQTF